VPGALSDLDREVRLCVYRRFLAERRPPGFEQVAEELEVPVEEAEAAFRRLEEGHVLVFAPGTLNIWMANPLSAVPTDFWVETPRGGYWGSCVWDAFGVVAMLGGEGTISTSCPDCGEPMELRVEESELIGGEGVAHFAVPARRWWDNIGFT
jgi:Alkylmercury lyase